MKNIELIRKIESMYSPSTACSYDNSGLNLLSDETEITNILLTVDVIDNCIEYGYTNKCNLIISHHPLIFNSFKNILNDSNSKKIKKLIYYAMSVYSIHTNFDVNKDNGMGKIVLNQFEFNDNIAVEKFIESNDDNLTGIGKYVELKQSITFKIIYDILCKNFNLNTDKIKTYIVNNNFDLNIKKIAILPGSGRSNINDILKLKPDVFISSDLSHHDILDLYENQISYIDATHYGLEKLFCFHMKNVLEHLIDDKNIKIFTYINGDF